MVLKGKICATCDFWYAFKFSLLLWSRSVKYWKNISFFFFYQKYLFFAELGVRISPLAERKILLAGNFGEYPPPTPHPPFNGKELPISIWTFPLGRLSNNQNGNLRWFLPLGVRSPPLNGTNFQTFFYPTFFLLQLNPTYMKRILHFKNITFKSSNWFKIDIHQQLKLLTANYLAMFKVTSTTIYT